MEMDFHTVALQNVLLLCIHNFTDRLQVLQILKTKMAIFALKMYF